MTSPTLSSSELASLLAASSGTDAATVQRVLKSLAATVSSTLAAGDALVLPGLGTFEPRDRAARTGRNPRTGESLEIAATRGPGFRPAAPLKRAVADGHTVHGEHEGAHTADDRETRPHGDHVDHLHDGHRHVQHGDHVDEH